ncbi:MAG: spermine synthase [Gammaproteobacteria bacterium HGW-Gammaproteobacteria-3]|nr:MAG: spermine synthase [Gammaproteobacteria bacterium HGW-Gammaproteobacteria-3]
MYKYDGLVVHQSHDDEGIIEIVESEGVRALHFGSSSRQSTMSIKAPDQLHSPYARAMMAWLLFKEQPGEVLMIGLGGGTLTKYLLHHFDECKIKVVEYRHGVVKIARSHFHLPLDPRLKIKIGEGGHFIRQHSLDLSRQYDLLMVDAFDHAGMATSVSGEAFFDSCKTLLKYDGILAINLWGTDKALFQQVAWHLGQIFNWRILFLPVRGRGNIIGFAFNEGVAKPTLKILKNRALTLEQHYHLEFPAFVQDFKRNNNKVFNRVIKS